MLIEKNNQKGSRDMDIALRTRQEGSMHWTHIVCCMLSYFILAIVWNIALIFIDGKLDSEE